MIRRLLVANRGEIVCRIARTARRLGVTTIAVYSDADRNAQHVRSADEAYHLGAAPAAESYLNIDKLIALAQRVGADAIHPGYGFLSENAGFAQACVDAGLIFVGPPAAAIEAMGSKSASKAAMAAVGVPVAPGYHGGEQSLRRLSEEALRVGFPLIIKASAGGGGKGMQVVNSAAEVAGAVESAQRLARTAFGDDRLLMERYFPQRSPRGSADLCGLARPDRQPVRSRLFGATPPSKDHRGSAGAGPARRGARRHGAGGGQVGASRGLCRRGHGRIPGRRCARISTSWK